MTRAAPPSHDFEPGNDRPRSASSFIGRISRKIARRCVCSHPCRDFLVTPTLIAVTSASECKGLSKKTTQAAAGQPRRPPVFSLFLKRFGMGLITLTLAASGLKANEEIYRKTAPSTALIKNG